MFLFIVSSVGYADVTWNHELCRQFSPTLCESGCTRDSISQFTIHGLWPQYTDGYPTYCTDDTFSVNSLEKSTLNQMNCEWDSYTTNTNSGSNEGFWAHEWEKHGTCSLTVLPTQEDYFSKALELNDKYDIDVVLQDAGIDMSGSTVATKDVQNALNDAFGVQGAVKCNGNSIQEVWMCFDKETYEPFTCPSSIKNGCSSSVEFPQADGSVEPTCEQYFPSSSTTSSVGAPSLTSSSWSRAGVLPSSMVGMLLFLFVH